MTRLTERQHQVAELVGDGLRYKQIAAVLDIGEDRVGQLVVAIAKKVGTPDDDGLDPRDVVFLWIRHHRWTESVVGVSGD